MEDIASSSKRGRDESLDFSSAETPEAKRLRADMLLDILDDDQNPEEDDEATDDLASVMRSLEEEIGLSPSPYHAVEEPSEVTCSCGADPLPANAVEEPLASVSDDSRQPELGFLFEASDDELGLPPTLSEEGDPSPSSSSSVPAAAGDGIPDVVGYGQIWGFEDEIPNAYDGFDMGFADENSGASAASMAEQDGGVYIHGGLFDDFGDAGLGVPTEFSWRQESFSAV